MREKALSIMQSIGDDPGVAMVYGDLANCYKRKGDTGRALEFFRKSLAIDERIGALHNAAKTYFNLGILYQTNIGDLAQARAHFEKAKALFEMVGDSENAHIAAQALHEL